MSIRFRRVLSLLAGILAVATGVDPWAMLTAAQGPERTVYVSVFDKQSRAPVADLGPDAFAVREDGVNREVLRVTPVTTPMAVAVLIDNSQAATQTIPDLRRGLETFLQRMAGIGPIALISVADRPTILVDYTTDEQALLQAARKVFAVPDSGATLLDALVETARGLRRRQEERGAIVAVTTENVEFSTLHFTQVLEPLAESGAALHSIVLQNPQGSLGSEEARNRASVLDRGTEESGGIRWDVLTSMAYEARLQDLASNLKAQYRVVYARPDSLIPPKKIEVEVRRAGLEAHGTPARTQPNSR